MTRSGSKRQIEAIAKPDQIKIVIGAQTPCGNARRAGNQTPTLYEPRFSIHDTYQLQRGEEVFDQTMPVLGEYGLGMKLHPFNGQRSVSHTHDDAVVG